MSIFNDDAQRQLFDELAEVARILGNTHRLMLLEHITQGERPVERLAELTGLTIANSSQHLQHLKRAGFVQSRREGKNVYYRLGNGPVQNLLAALHQYVEYRNSEIAAFIADTFNRREHLESISREELFQRLNLGEVTLLDVRPSEEFASGHLPGAINIPAEELEGRLSELPKEQEIVAYCRGPYCVLSLNAMKILRSKGFLARRLEEGFPAWKAAGFEVQNDR
ncbi:MULTISPECIES: ArsR/SmtB family transcription factor [Photorhabdus]|uniref:Transcriptional regulator n=2 Tax=Photorhabdus asymbiotica TaxID=291112 RepID=B6VNR9_PHOAA|nr:metalloregulator ArsR/SmtB family transcription factor [Photorhabdus asymbiotica]RKS59331.1 ArsR family transcriptional regulator [Photorhabdus asymbiotica]CAQ85466.1 Transcriptional regulator [Photorhabdus asymbiotica]CAR67800.1 Transcriptional regulator [Photorhabdus asymbiotica subsp. asymbiotica ATCC 43949]